MPFLHPPQQMTSLSHFVRGQRRRIRVESGDQLQCLLPHPLPVVDDAAYISQRRFDVLLQIA